MPDPTDEAQAAPPPTIRRTALQVAESAAELAAALQDALDADIRPALTQLRTDMTDFGAELRKIATDIASATGPVAVGMAEDAEIDRISSIVHVAMEPIVEGANTKLAELAREALARDHALSEIGARASELNARVGALDGFREAAEGRLGAVETMTADVDMVELLDERLRRLEQRITADGGVAPSGQGMVHAKILDLMRAITHIAKDREAPKSAGGFKFRGIDAAMDAVGRAQREIGLLIVPTVVNVEYVNHEGHNSDGRKVMYTSARVVMRYTFTDPDDGSTVVMEMPGEARDSGDRATGKSLSMALKFGLFQALMIPVEDSSTDAESEDLQVHTPPPDRPAAPPAAQGPTVDLATPEGRAARARQALAAMRGINAHPVERRAAELARVRAKIEEEKLGGFEIEGATLRAHGAAVFQTLASETPGGEF